LANKLGAERVSNGRETSNYYFGTRLTKNVRTNGVCKIIIVSFISRFETDGSTGSSEYASTFYRTITFVLIANVISFASDTNYGLRSCFAKQIENAYDRRYYSANDNNKRYTKIYERTQGAIRSQRHTESCTELGHQRAPVRVRTFRALNFCGTSPREKRNAKFAVRTRV